MIDAEEQPACVLGSQNLFSTFRLSLSMGKPEIPHCPVSLCLTHLGLEKQVNSTSSFHSKQLD